MMTKLEGKMIVKGNSVLSQFTMMTKLMTLDVQDKKLNMCLETKII